mmetsp:Transcript_15598/g.23169  ORF Transcript_15598/g.23169 Transcript_15598/m.23169 type:complete len:1315 (-) Transcript_15598:252-4196(-)
MSAPSGRSPFHGGGGSRRRSTASSRPSTGTVNNAPSSGRSSMGGMSLDVGLESPYNPSTAGAGGGGGRPSYATAFASSPAWNDTSNTTQQQSSYNPYRASSGNQSYSSGYYHPNPYPVHPAHSHHQHHSNPATSSSMARESPSHSSAMLFSMTSPTASAASSFALSSTAPSPSLSLASSSMMTNGSHSYYSNPYRRAAATTTTNTANTRTHHRSKSRTPPRHRTNESAGGILAHAIPPASTGLPSSSTKKKSAAALRPSIRTLEEHSIEVEYREKEEMNEKEDVARFQLELDQEAEDHHDKQEEEDDEKAPPTPPPATTTSPTVKEISSEEENQITTLRSLTTHTLHSPSHSTTSSSSSLASFYGSILYAKTNLSTDAYLLAQALYQNDEKKRAILLLEQAGLLQTSTTTTTTYYEQTKKPVDLKLQMEATLLASSCYSSLGEWEEALVLLEGVMRYNPPHAEADYHNTMFAPPYHSEVESFLHDGNDPRLYLLASTFTTDVINPVAKLCVARGKAYDELGNSTKACSFLKAALKIDVKCVDALHYLLERHLLTREEERDLICSLEFDSAAGGSGKEDLKWLKDLCLARLSAGGVVSVLGSSGAGVGGTHEHQNGGSTEEKKTLKRVVEEDMMASTNQGMKSPPPSFIIRQSSSSSRIPGRSFHNQHENEDDEVGVDIMDASSIHLEQTHHHSMLSPGTPHFGHPTSGGREEDDCKPSAATTTTDAIFPSTSSPAEDVEAAFRNLHLSHRLSHSPEVLSLAAIRSYNTYNLTASLSYCHMLSTIDPLCPTASYVHIATLVGLKHKRPLFQLAHRLVDANPKSACAWYAVGCYYHLCQRYDLAQRHFCRATRLNPRSAECWIGFGCSFAACDESDQALASYRAAQRLHGGSHNPMLYMGMEYLRTNHLSLAGHFLKSARGLGSGDPLCCNELGVWCFKRGEFGDAAGWFNMALRLCTEARFTGDSLALLESEVEEIERREMMMVEEKEAELSMIRGKEEEEEYVTATMRQGEELVGEEDGDGKPPLSTVRFNNNNSALKNVNGVTKQQQSSSSSQPILSTNATTTSTTTTSVRQQQQLKRSRHRQQRRQEQLSDLDCIDLCQDPFWEPTIFNLGHSYRKLRQFVEAAACFEKCLSLCPGNAASYAALGFTKHLTGDINGAIESYHQSLSRKPDDPFSSEMLDRALHEALASPDPFLTSATIAATEAETRHDNGGGNGDGSFLSDGVRGSNSLMSPSLRGGGADRDASFFSNSTVASATYTPPTKSMNDVSSYTPRNGTSSGRRHRGRGSATPHSMATDDASNFTMESGDVDMSMT